MSIKTENDNKIALRLLISKSPQIVQEAGYFRLLPVAEFPA
jgi:hypothetical protein